MATKNKNQDSSVRSLLNDSRSVQIAGIFILFIAVCLTIAFISYLFTWQQDQDKVLKFEFSLLFLSNISCANWLGRAGAVFSNMFFFWGFGVASFGLLYFLYYWGFALLLKNSIRDIFSMFKRVAFGVLSFSVLMGFIFSSASFPYGGVVGKSIAHWLTSFIGVMGVVVLFIALIFVAAIWFLNPDLSKMSFSQMIEEIKLRGLGLFSFRYRSIVKTPILRDEGQGEGSIIPTVKAKPAPKKVEAQKPLERRNLKKEEQLTIDFTGKPVKEQPKPSTDLEIQVAAPNEDANDEEETPLSSASPLANQHPAVADDDPNAPFDPKKDLSLYEYPHLSLLNEYSDQKIEVNHEELEDNKDQIVNTLLNYKIEITKIKATVGPTVTLYEIVPAPGVRISKIKNLEDDIALSLAALGIRIIAPIPGKGTVGIEVPNKKKRIVSLREVLRSDKFKNGNMDLPIALGKTIQNEVFIADLTRMPHLLIAGATGQGKSVGINTILMSLLYKKHPSQVKMVLIDPKKVELYPFTKLESHFLAALDSSEDLIVTDTNQVISVLNSLTIEMDNRYELLKTAHARNLKEYNEKFISRRLNPNKGHKFLPYIVLVIDEFADLIMTAGKEVELPIGRLAQLSRAVGIHLIIATQRPSVNIITGVIKANFPARIAFKVSAKVDSRTILDTGGADRLIGRGDMLLSLGGDIIRLQCAFVDTPEVEEVLNHIHGQQGYPLPYQLPEYREGEGGEKGKGEVSFSDLDDNFEDAARLVVQNQHGSTSMIQRRLKLGYNRAGRIMDQMESFGIVGPSEGSKPREVLFFDEMELNRFLENLKSKK